MNLRRVVVRRRGCCLPLLFGRSARMHEQALITTSRSPEGTIPLGFRPPVGRLTLAGLWATAFLLWLVVVPLELVLA